MTRLHLVKNPITAKPKLVEIDFHPKPGQRQIDGIPFLWQRLQEEKRQGKVTKLAPDHYFFSISVTEPREMIPWIRSFGAEAKVRPSEHHDLIEILQRHRKEMAEIYGLISPLS